LCFSGDKLLGGPQAGIIVGRAAVIAQLKRHPLMRALRPDKSTLAGLGATLGHYLRGEAEREVPVWRMIAARPEEIEARARRMADRLGTTGACASIVDGASAVGGGSLPGETLPTRLLALATQRDPLKLARALRRASPPIVPRVERDRVVLDLRTVLPEEDDTLVVALESVLSEPADVSGG
jgi:L-seryl-tRNA(Ser) seleniumtransferase